MPSWPGPRLQRMLPLKSHPKATSWGGCQTGRQNRTRRPGVWPQFPSSQHTHSLPTGEQKPRYLPQQSASLAWAPTDPARRPQQLRLLFRGPIASNSLARARAEGGFPEGFLNGLADKHPVGGACAQSLALQGHKGDGATTLRKWPGLESLYQTARLGCEVVHRRAQRRGCLVSKTKTSGLNHY